MPFEKNGTKINPSEIEGKQMKIAYLLGALSFLERV